MMVDSRGLLCGLKASNLNSLDCQNVEHKQNIVQFDAIATRFVEIFGGPQSSDTRHPTL